ncbi:MAG: metal-sulfur cluster assembly factor, partial [Chloroflexota bacterium]
MAPRRVHDGPAQRRWSDLVIDAQTAGPSEREVRAALARIPDPELPVLSIVDLGIVHRVDVSPEAIDVAILPTFVGCP